MKPKPAHLGPDYASQFCDESVAAAYHTRPPYPEETFDILTGLLPEEAPATILELGCGSGDLTIPLARRADHVDAVDFSAAMLSRARPRPGADSPAIAWHCMAAERFRSETTYSLVCAGASLHWMDWAVLFPRIKGMLHGDGFLAIVNREVRGHAWESKVRDLIPRYSTNRDFQPYDLVDELASRGLFAEYGRKATRTVPFEQDLEDYIESFHSSNGFSRDRMKPESAAEFDARVRDIVSGSSPGNTVAGVVRATVIWGRP